MMTAPLKMEETKPTIMAGVSRRLSANDLPINVSALILGASPCDFGVD